ncbi:hypothetical protein [Paenibacillus xylanilyticus]|uniref:hypothetical protein n=1 Tax=Paenibacillus xylanilyticus TaxID=248903 RepID=UPI003AAF23CF
MSKNGFGIIIGILGLAVVAVGVFSYVNHSKSELTQYHSKGIIKAIETKEKAIVVEDYKVRYSLSMDTLIEEGPTDVVFDNNTKVYLSSKGNGQKKATIDQLKPNQTVELMYEFPNDHIVRASEIVIVSD